MTYYRNLPRHLTGAEESRLDGIVASATHHAASGIGYSPRHEAPRVWLEDCAAEMSLALDNALVKMGLMTGEEDAA